MSKLLSQRKFAEKVGRSHVYINKLVKQGKIPLVNGKIPEEEGVKAFNESQQLGYEENRQNGKKQREQAKKTVKPAKKKAAKKEKDPDIELPEDDSPLPSTGNLTADKVTQAFNRARLAEKTYNAKIKELEFKEKQGLLIPIEVIEEDAASTALEIQGLLNSIGPRIAPICEGKPARIIESLITEAISEAMVALKKSRFNKGK